MGYIYKISNIIDDRVYIGSTIRKRVEDRWDEHKNDLLNGKHANIHLQRFFYKYGFSFLIFSIIEEVENESILIREQHYLDVLKNKFNISTNSSAPTTGRHHSLDSINKISVSTSGENNHIYEKKDLNG